ncbi:MAG: hypothetical protein GXP63_05780 [DPANN group archaeon]|nr:hypothetical protein [DPANN group archaeon]
MRKKVIILSLILFIVFLLSLFLYIHYERKTALCYKLNLCEHFDGLISDTPEHDLIAEAIVRYMNTYDVSLYMPKKEYSLEKGESEVFLFGLKNIKSYPIESRINIICSKAPNATCGDSDEKIVLTFSSEYGPIEPNEIQLVPVQIARGSKVPSGQYAFQVKVIFSSENETLSESESFFVNAR